MTTFHDPKDAQKYRARLRKQREYQRKYRERLIGQRAPERDDIARACLRALIEAVIRREAHAVPLAVAALDGLAAIGFDREAAHACLRRMVRKRIRAER